MLCIRFACKFNWICAEYDDGMPIDNNDYLFVESSDLGDEIYINFFFSYSFQYLFNRFNLIWLRKFNNYNIVKYLNSIFSLEFKI